MSKRFVVLLDNCTLADQNALEVYFKKFGWWHWLPNSWLLIDATETLTASKVRDDLQELVPGKNMLILEFTATGYTWSGYGPKEEGGKNMFTWLDQYWGSK